MNMGCIKCLLLTSLVIFVTLSAYLYWTSETDLPPLKIEDEFWGVEKQQQKNDGKIQIREFKISVKDSEIADLKQRLHNARLSIPLKGVNFEYGMNTNYLKTVLSYWSNKYDWKAEVKRLNSFPQYIMNIDGLEVHYVQVKPKEKNKKVIPIILIHGWPGSVVEFYGSIPLLTESRIGEDFVFEVICPHIPGYGFSEAPSKPGFNFAQAAKLFLRLMDNLGHKKFYAQGGDWGAAITSAMAMIEPQRVLGLHLNMLAMTHKNINIAKWILGSYFPQLGPPKEFISKGTYPISRYISNILRETGYMHIQATKPDTVGVGLSDSPAGLAAYILEKFMTWTDIDSLSKENGGLTDKFTLDDLITNVMIYWVTNSITSSARFYKESFSSELQELQLNKRPILVPSGLLFCEKDFFSNGALGYTVYKNLVSTEKADCGHFAALENPKMFTDSVRNFTKAVQNMEERKKKQKEDL